MSDLRELARSLRPYIEQAARSMEYTYGLYYADPEDGKVYLCTRTGEADGGTITLHYLPHELVGMYFEEVAG